MPVNIAPAHRSTGCFSLTIHYIKGRGLGGFDSSFIYRNVHVYIVHIKGPTVTTLEYFIQALLQFLSIIQTLDEVLNVITFISTWYA